MGAASGPPAGAAVGARRLLAAARTVPPRVIALALIVVVSLSVTALALLQGWVRRDTLQELVRGAGGLGMALYVVGIVVIELLWMPRIWGLLAGGVLFGPLLGGALSLVGDMGGAAACYLIARGAGREWVTGLLSSRPRVGRVVELLARRRGGGTVAVLRMAPAAHYTLVSYAAGLTGVSPAAFLLGTAVGILPGAALYPLLGDSMLEPTSPVFLGSIAIMIVFTVVTVAAGRRALRD